MYNEPQQSMIGSSGLVTALTEAKQQDSKPTATFGNLQTQFNHLDVGPQSGDVEKEARGWSFAGEPVAVFCQARRQDDVNRNWPDQFGIQVIKALDGVVKIRVRRTDVNGGGWGQNLRVDILVVY